ncbi:MAG: hypothetical protein LBE91_12415 [Tannerella sp.]|jgi:hypothetical protein|nr:hypothetical protein [Tannerella sp.]
MKKHVSLCAYCGRAGSGYETDDFDEIKSKAMNTLAKLFHTFLLPVFYVFLCSDCSSSSEESRYSDHIIGRWKLVSFTVNYSQPETFDYSKENIIFDFQENDTLVVTGPWLPQSGVFDDIWSGEYLYWFSSPNVPSGSDPPQYPVSNLDIHVDDMVFGYYCRASLDEKTMSIISVTTTVGSEEDDLTTVYNWEKKFIKIK